MLLLSGTLTKKNSLQPRLAPQKVEKCCLKYLRIFHYHSMIFRWLVSMLKKSWIEGENCLLFEEGLIFRSYTHSHKATTNQDRFEKKKFFLSWRPLTNGFCHVLSRTWIPCILYHIIDIAYVWQTYIWIKYLKVK